MSIFFYKDYKFI